MEFLMGMKDVFDEFDMEIHRFVKLHKALFFSMQDRKSLFRGQQLVLIMLNKINGCTQKDLAEALNIKPSSLTDILQRMEKSNLVERRTDKHDLRVTRVFFTEKGIAQIDGIRKQSRMITDITLKGFTEEDKKKVIEYFERMSHNIKNRLDSEGRNCFEKLN